MYLLQREHVPQDKTTVEGCSEESIFKWREENVLHGHVVLMTNHLLCEGKERLQLLQELVSYRDGVLPCA